MVITLDKHKKPLGTCTEKRARKLMENKRACVYRYYPFTIIIKDVDVNDVKPTEKHRVKIDPGAKHTGIAVVRESDNAVVLTMQIEHKAENVVSNLKARSASRRNRRQRETRYRRPKFGNKFLKKGRKPCYDSIRPYGWLPPSEQSIVDNIINVIKKLSKLLRIKYCSFEANRFDTQLLDDPDIEGKEYQHGELFGCEIKEYLLDRYAHTCQYCGGKSGDSVLEWEHKRPKSRGGSDSVKNATLACHTCNQEKDNKTPEEWLNELIAGKKDDPLTKKRISLIPKVIEGKTTGSNRYCAWANVVRLATERRLYAMFDESNIECSSGGKTKYNRTQLGLPKDHHYDALCVGTVPSSGYKDLTHGYVLLAKAKGRGSRLRGNTNECGIIIVKYHDRSKRKFGFQTGDIVHADVPKGKYAGSFTGRVNVRGNGYFNITTKNGVKVAKYSNCVILQRIDGYSYIYEKRKA